MIKNYWIYPLVVASKCPKVSHGEFHVAKDGNEQGSIALGAAPSKEQLALAKRSDALGPLETPQQPGFGDFDGDH